MGPVLRHHRASIAAMTSPGRQRFVAALIACLLVLAQLAMTVHSLHHIIADHGEQHHCPACKLADHSPTVPAMASPVVADGAVEVEVACVFEVFIPSILRPALPRGPPLIQS